MPFLNLLRHKACDWDKKCAFFISTCDAISCDATLWDWKDRGG